MNLGWESGKDKQTMQFAFPSSATMVKSHEKKCQNYFHVTTITMNDMVKCQWNMNFEEIDNEFSAGKNDGLWLLWGISKEYIKQNIIMAMLRRVHSHSVVTCRLMNKLVI